MGARNQKPAARRGAPVEPLILAAGIAIALAAIAPIVVHWLTNPPDQRLVDLEVYRDGGRAVVRGAPLYDVLTQPPQFLPFTYPPFAALLAVPFTLMSWKASQWVWTAMIYIALVTVVAYAFRDLIRRTGRWWPIAGGVLVGAMAWLVPVYDQMRFGQVGLFLMALCLADCATERARWPRGLFIGLAVAIKLVPGVFLIYLWVVGRRDAAWNAVLTAAVVTLGSFAVLPSDSADFWFGALLEGGDRTGAVNGTTNQAINGLIARVDPPSPLGTLLWLVLGGVMAYYGYKLSRRATLAADELTGPDSYSARLAGIGIVGLLSVLLSPVGWIHHLVWIIVIVGALAGDGRDTRRWRIAALVWLYFLFPLPWWGTKLIGPEDPLISVIVGRIVQHSFGIAAVILVMIMGVWLVDRLLNRPVKPGSSRNDAGVGTLTP
ncbi:glycosyltransferase 87 family protein [Spirillospora sp. CA-294931]|uniref:glycosyltransferase 87 family protein n=1 Tax=Spirillospora sp. CA-294931 TaxID=3240042 RepID=UPI003D8CD47D